MRLLKGKKIIALGVAISLAFGITGGVCLYKNKTMSNAAFFPFFNKKTGAQKVNYSYNELLPTIAKVSKEYAKVFAKNMLKKEVQCNEVTPIYDIKQNVIGYSIAISEENVPCGYINLDFTKEQVVADFSLQEDTRSMYQVLVDGLIKKNSDIKESDCTNKLYNVDGAEYAISVRDSQKNELVYLDNQAYSSSEMGDKIENYALCYLDEMNNNYSDYNNYNDGNSYLVATAETENNTRNNSRNLSDVITAGNINQLDEKFAEEKEKLAKKYDEVKEKVVDNFLSWLKKVSPSVYNEFFGDKKYECHDDVFIEPEDFVEEYSFDENKAFYIDKYDPSKSLISQETIMTSTNRYACALVGILEIINQEDMLLDGDLTKSFNKLWDIAKCENFIESTETFYGDVEVDCAVTFGPFHGSILKKYGKLVDREVSYKYMIKPSFETLKSYLNKQSPIILDYMIKDFTGHGINVFGYYEGQIGSEEANYLIVANGWDDDAPRYVLYDTDAFVLPSCTAYTIK